MTPRNRLRNTEARRNYEKALKICEAVRGSEHPQYAEFLNSLGALHQTLGDYHEARVCLETSRKILFKHKPKSPTYAVVLNNLGMVLESLGLYEEAEESCRTSVGIREENKARAADYSRPLNNLGDLLEKRGAYQEALVLLRKSLAMRKPGTPEYAVAVNNLAGLYHSMGDYNKAIGLYKEALRIRRMTLEPEHPHYADSLNNIAGMLSAAGRYKGAIENYQQALKVYEESLGKDSPECGTVLNNMALTLTEMGKFKEALDYLNRARVICLKRQGRKSRPYVTNSHNIAGVWAGLGEYELAESECRKAIRMRTKLVGERHPDVSNSWNMLGSILHRAKRYEEAGRVLRRASDLRLRHLELISSVQSMRQQVGAAKRSSDFFSLLVENALAWDGADDAEFATDLWHWKGLVTSRQRAYRVAQGTAEHSAAFRRFYKTTQQLAMASMQAPKGLREDASASEKTVYAERHRIWVDRVNKLTEERERHEEALAGSLSEFRELRERLTVEEVCQALPPESCLIDFFEYRRAKAEPGKTIQYDYRYAALVVRKDGFVKLVDLKSVDEMDKAIAEFRRAFTGKEAGAISVFSCGKSIRDRLWRPLEQYLAGVKTVLVSPDMAIGTVPFAAIPDKGGKYLVESYAFCTLPLTAALRTMAARRLEPGLKDLLIVGDVDYGKLPGEANQVATRRSGQPREGWSRLDGSGLETDALESFWWRQFGKRPTVLREGDATEARLAKEAPRHRNIFLSTHGYFDEPVGPNPIGISDMASPGQRISVLAPGLLTGFVLANANNPKAIGVKSADGILTASEIEALRLKNVDLVFVAGCETGLGKAASGEGLASIQRGFYVAGVGSCVAALWAIDDEATLKLTREFCRNCWGSKRLKKIEALRQAQLKVLRDPNGIKVRGKTPVGEIRKKRTHPYYWAAFQLSGDWR